MLGRRDVLLGAASLATTTMLGGLPKAGAAGINDQDLLKFFDTLALMRTTRKSPGPRPGKVRKWTGSVIVRARGSGAAAQRDALHNLLEETSDLTGLHFKYSSGARSLDNIVTIYFVTEEEMKRIYGPESRSVCFTHTRGRSGSLKLGRIRIRENFEDCLHHEFMHALGFDNHWPGPKSGIDASSSLAHRNSAERTQGYSEWDKRAIRMLYHPRLRPGSPRKAALTDAAEIVSEIALA